MHKDLSRQLKKKQEQLNKRLVERKENAFLLKNTRLLDDYFCERFEKSVVGLRLGLNRTPYALVALGGYGREEQCVHSDVDILFLFDQKVPAEAEELIREFLYPLWDIRLVIGYATRSIEDCVKLAGTDLEILTSLLDARFICGMSPLFSRMTDQLKEQVTTPHAKKITGWIHQRCMERHANFGDASYLLEPNLKNGLGGLRDYHNMLWLARVRAGLNTPRDLEYSGHLSHNEYEIFRRSLTFIWEVRNRLHLLTGRKTDQLHFEYQTELAQALRIGSKNGQKPVERFMGKLHGHMEFIKQRHLMFLAEMTHPRKTGCKHALCKPCKVKGLEIACGMLTFALGANIPETPMLLMDIFLESTRLKLPLSAEAKRVVSEFGYITKKLGSREEAVKKFEKILVSVTPEFNVLDEMLGTRFIVKFIPEFKGIVNRIQYNQYHIFPVDKHSLQVVQSIKKLARNTGENEEEAYSAIYAGLRSKKTLLWAALLHDIGKGVPGDEHSEPGAALAGKILMRLGLPRKKILDVQFLIKKHLFLVNIARRRDIDDEETAIFCARKIMNVERLKMLYLLTVADSMSTGPKAWNPWTAQLLRNLFWKVLKILSQKDLVTCQSEKAIEKKRLAVLSAGKSLVTVARLEKRLESMPPRYLLYTPTEDVVEHMRLYDSMGSRKFGLSVTEKGRDGYRRAVVCGQDRPGFFSRMAGVLTLNGFDILDAQIYTWGRKTALDIFTIKPLFAPDREEERLKRVEENLEAALSGEIDFKKALLDKMGGPAPGRQVGIRDKEDRVEVDNEWSSFFTIIEVFAYDFPGLLFWVTDAIYKSGLDTYYAKINTHMDQVVDVFYVRNIGGEKLFDKKSIAHLKSNILGAIKSASPHRHPPDPVREVANCLK